MFPTDKIENWNVPARGIWGNVPEAQWNDWKWQMRNRIETRERLESLMPLSADERAGFAAAENRLAFALTPYFFSLMERENFSDPLRLQTIPRGGEGRVSEDESEDPIGEEKFSPVPGIVHRYRDRALLISTDRCACYCRYCTRSRLVSGARGNAFSPRLENALEYISAHGEIRDVLVSGGDCLLLSDEKIDALLGRLRAIPHVKFVRLGSRVPVFLPQRITPELCAILKKHGGVWLSIHANHPRECTRELATALERLSFAGVVLANQSVLLRGVNDDFETLRSLFHRLLQMRVRPYYLYACDKINGSAHFRVSVEKGRELIAKLRASTTGYAVPMFVEDTPERGKIVLA